MAQGFYIFLVIQHTHTRTKLRKYVQAHTTGISGLFFCRFFFFKAGLKLVLSTSIYCYWEVVCSQAWGGKQIILSLKFLIL